MMSHQQLHQGSQSYQPLGFHPNYAGLGSFDGRTFCPPPRGVIPNSLPAGGIQSSLFPAFTQSRNTSSLPETDKQPKTNAIAARESWLQQLQRNAFQPDFVLEKRTNVICVAPEIKVDPGSKRKTRDWKRDQVTAHTKKRVGNCSSGMEEKEEPPAKRHKAKESVTLKSGGKSSPVPQSRDVSPAVTIKRVIGNQPPSPKPPNVSLAKQESLQQFGTEYSRDVPSVLYSAGWTTTEQLAGRRVIPEATKIPGMPQPRAIAGLKLSLEPANDLDSESLSKVQSKVDFTSEASLNSKVSTIPLKPKYSGRARKASKTKQQGSHRKATKEPGQKGKKRAYKKKAKGTSKSKKRKVADMSAQKDNSVEELQKLGITSLRTTTKTRSGKHVTFNLVPQVRTFTRKVKQAPEVEAKEMGNVATTLETGIKERDPIITDKPDHLKISERGVETLETKVKSVPELVVKMDAEVNPTKFLTGMKPDGVVTKWSNNQKTETDNKDSTVLEEGQIPDNATQAKSAKCVVEAPDKDVIFNAATLFGLGRVDEEDMLDPLGENAKTVERYDTHSNEDLLNNISSSALESIQGKKKKRKKKALKISKRHEFTTMTAPGF